MEGRGLKEKCYGKNCVIEISKDTRPLEVDSLLGDFAKGKKTLIGNQNITLKV